MQGILNRAACGSFGLFLLAAPVLADPASAEAGLLVYRVEQPGAEPFVSRILVTPKYLRMDQGGGPDDNGFVLYERGRNLIHSVDHDNRSILQMQATGRLPAEPDNLLLSERPFEPQDAPELSGGRPVGYQLFSNQELCGRVVAAPGLMADALGGLREFRTALAEQQGASLAALPPEMNSACDLAIHVYAPVRDLQYGLPLSIEDSGGRQSLMDFNPVFPVDPAMFRLPEGYRTQSLQEIREGLSP